MSIFNDGITKNLENYLNKISQAAFLSIEAVKDVIDDETEKLANAIKKDVPKKSGGLANALTKKTCDKNYGEYGYKILFEGENGSGVPYEKIANVLNSGTPKIKPLKFIDKNVRKLKGLDDRINNEFLKRISEKVGE